MSVEVKVEGRRQRGSVKFRWLERANADLKGVNGGITDAQDGVWWKRVHGNDVGKGPNVVTSAPCSTAVQMLGNKYRRQKEELSYRPSNSTSNNLNNSLARLPPRVASEAS